jgi:hypothetical protein
MNTHVELDLRSLREAIANELTRLDAKLDEAQRIQQSIAHIARRLRAGADLLGTLEQQETRRG